MNEGIWAIWYDLPESGNDDYISWLHENYLPDTLKRPGIAWAAHYQAVQKPNKVHQYLTHTDDEEVGTGTQYVLVVGATHPYIFFGRDSVLLDLEADPEVKEMVSRRQGARPCVFAQEAFATGPEYGSRTPGSTPAPAIQMGSFRTSCVEDEYNLAQWYAQYRMPAVSSMPGCVAVRKLLSVVGWAKHSVMYEFTSLQAREDHFLKHESLGLKDGEWTNKIVTYTRHSPGSPTIGERIWPAVP
ncbi:MAG: hypothetical protein ISR52_08555 [Rhodospirillales bacterium]|nr:hypothetical protein [Rhodospirillales bacterium]